MFDFKLSTFDPAHSCLTYDSLNLVAGYSVVLLENPCGHKYENDNDRMGKKTTKYSDDCTQYIIVIWIWWQIIHRPNWTVTKFAPGIMALVLIFELPKKKRAPYLALDFLWFVSCNSFFSYFWQLKSFFYTISGQVFSLFFYRLLSVLWHVYAETLSVLARQLGENFRPLATECLQFGFSLINDSTEPDLRRTM
jgi:hypothetical protein